MASQLLRGLLPLMATGGAAAMLQPNEAEAGPVFSKDGRRLLDLLNKASSGTLERDEPVFIYHGTIPDYVMTSLKNDDSNFVSNTLASQEEDIWHYWNARHNSMTNEEIENALEALTTGTTRFHTKGNPPYENGIGVITEDKAYNGSLAPETEYTRIYQVNPLKEKRLLKKVKSLSESTDGSAFHPIATPSEDGVLPQRALSADVDSSKKLSHDGKRVNINFSDKPSGTTDAGSSIQEPGLKTPLFDPMDVLMLGYGFPGKIGKILGTMRTPVVDAGMDAAVNGILGYFQKDSKIATGGGGW